MVKKPWIPEDGTYVWFLEPVDGKPVKGWYDSKGFRLTPFTGYFKTKKEALEAKRKITRALWG